VTFLNQVTFGTQQIGQRIVIAGVEKSGKSTLGSNAPRCLGVPIVDMGLDKINVATTPLITSWDDLILLFDEIKASCIKGNFKFKTILFDTATQIEQLIHKKVIETDPKPAKNNTMETCHEGYGKGYSLANQYFSRFTDYCDLLAKNANINIVVTCHVFPSRVVDPAFGEYDTWDLLLHSPKNNKTFGKREMITQWADMIGFLHEPLYVQKNDKGQTLLKAMGANQGRVIGVDRTPGWVGGNRYGLTGTIPIPKPPDNPNEPYRNGWNSIAHAIYSNSGIDIYNKDV